MASHSDSPVLEICELRHCKLKKKTFLNKRKGYIGVKPACVAGSRSRNMRGFALPKARGRGVLLGNLGVGVRPATGNPYLISDQNL